MTVNGNKTLIGAGATIIACLVTAIVLLLVTRGSGPRLPQTAGELPPAVWEKRFDDLESQLEAIESLTRTVESHMSLQTSYNQSQNELLREIRNELRRRPGG